jgi:hypothetical protein
MRLCRKPITQLTSIESCYTAHLSLKPIGDTRTLDTLGNALTACVVQQVYCWLGHFLFLPARGRGLRVVWSVCSHLGAGRG